MEKGTHIKSLYAGILFMLLLSFVDFFKNLLFQKILSGTLSECQMVWIHICRSSTGSKLFAKVISRRQKWLPARKVINAHRSSLNMYFIHKVFFQSV